MPEHKLDAMAEEQQPGVEEPSPGEDPDRTDERAADERAADERAADERAADERAADERAADERAADERAADERAADERAADERAADERAADERAADEGAADERAADEDAAAKRTLCRSSTDKVIAGVAGGIGAYFGIDSVIVRIAFIVLTFLGGAGPFLYLIGWLALPKEDSRSVVAKALGGDSPHRFRSLMAVALIGLGLLITANVSGSLFGLFIDVWRIAPYLALILIAAGVALVLWPGPAGRPQPAPARPPAPPPPPSSAYATGEPLPPSAAGPERPLPPSAAGPERPLPPSAAGPERPLPPSAAGPERPLPPSAAGPAEEPRRRRSVIGSVTVAALFVYTGAAMMLDRLDAVDVDLGVFFAVALAITGAGLLASAFAHPARGLIALGVALSAPLLLFVGVDVPRGSGIGEDRVSVADIDELKDEYRHGIGQLTVDLRNLDPARTDHSVELSLGIGELRVYVPETIATTADIDVRAGNIVTRGSGYTSYSWTGSEDGFDVSRTVTVPAHSETTGELRLDIDVGIGEARLITGPAPVEGSNR